MTLVQQTPSGHVARDAVWRVRLVAAATVLAVVLVVVAMARLQVLRTWGTAAWNWFVVNGSATSLQWLLALLPGSIIVNHLVYLLSSRRKQFRRALGKLEATEATQLEDLYFGYVPMFVRYLLPAILVTILTSTAIAVLTNPGAYLTWLYEQAATAKITEFLPKEGWAQQILRGAALGFVGAYVYMLLLLTARAQHRDITTGIAVWAAAMPVLGPMMGGVAALLVVSGAGDGASVTRDAVFFVAGMLPRQFMTFVQSSVRKMFQSGAPSTTRTLPLTTLRGIGPDVEARLEEEGIYDVSSLAYASPHALMRTTTYSARQITDWIDEALLIATLPSHWEALERVGVTGAMDLAWYQTSKDSIKPLADEIKISEMLLANVVERLSQDAQIGDLYQLYWDHSTLAPPIGGGQHGAAAQAGANPPPPAPQPPQPQTNTIDGVALAFDVRHDLEKEARDRLVAEITAKPGVRSAALDGDRLAMMVDPALQDALNSELRGKPEFSDTGQPH
jgi:hypothetical protein